tara:strand:+ start:907 stop:1173 length:267 start_codon:yes stop_codon:yes gene_type:complete
MFEIISYSIDYYVNGKLYGSVKLPEPDRKTMGYAGRQTKIQTTDLKLKKLIKAGTTVTTECVPICGKLLGTQREKFAILQNSRSFYNK